VRTIGFTDGVTEGDAMRVYADAAPLVGRASEVERVSEALRQRLALRAGQTG
jgi:hypothetical protein